MLIIVIFVFSDTAWSACLDFTATGLKNAIDQTFSRIFKHARYKITKIVSFA